MDTRSNWLRGMYLQEAYYVLTRGIMCTYKRHNVYLQEAWAMVGITVVCVGPV